MGPIPIPQSAKSRDICHQNAAKNPFLAATAGIDPEEHPAGDGDFIGLESWPGLPVIVQHQSLPQTCVAGDHTAVLKTDG